MICTKIENKKKCRRVIFVSFGQTFAINEKREAIASLM